MVATEAHFDKVFSELDRVGLLLEQDASFPSAVRLITGGRVHGSWWAHAQSHLIYDVLGQLSAHADVLIAKLLSKKVTFVHRKLWPAIYTVGTAREDWQVKALTPAAKSLLKKLDRDSDLQTDILIAVGGYESKALSKAVSELEGVLLIYSEQFHTERGKHARRLETWPHWAARIDFKNENLSPGKAKAELQRIVDEQNHKAHAKATLLWL